MSSKHAALLLNFLSLFHQAFFGLLHEVIVVHRKIHLLGFSYVRLSFPSPSWMTDMNDQLL